MLLDFRDVLPEEEAQAPSDERQEAFDEREAERGWTRPPVITSLAK